LVLFTSYIAIYLTSPWIAPLSTRTPKSTRFDGSSFGIYSRFRSGMEFMILNYIY